MTMEQRERVADALSLTRRWSVANVAAAAVLPDRSTVFVGPQHHVFRLASISKMLVGWAALGAVEDGVRDLDERRGAIDGVDMAGCTPRHLLAHAAGFAFDTTERLAAPGTRRIYSNTGIELFASHLARVTAMPFVDYLREGVLEPLGMSSTTLDGSPARDIFGTVADLVRFVLEVTDPVLVSPAAARAFRSPQFAGLAGVVPGVGRFDDCAWGLGTELRDGKRPHWTGPRNSAATFGHFGGAGTLLWVDPEAATACVALTDRPFDEWASEALVLWPALADALLLAVSGERPDAADGSVTATPPVAATPAAPGRQRLGSPVAG
ncbi:MAG: serine hydrolase domain-containing protein [Ilumatobacteraceae bacterium]